MEFIWVAAYQESMQTYAIFLNYDPTTACANENLVYQNDSATDLGLNFWTGVSRITQ